MQQLIVEQELSHLKATAEGHHCLLSGLESKLAAAAAVATDPHVTCAHSYNFTILVQLRNPLRLACWSDGSSLTEIRANIGRDMTDRKFQSGAWTYNAHAADLHVDDAEVLHIAPITPTLQADCFMICEHVTLRAKLEKCVRALMNKGRHKNLVQKSRACTI